MENKKCSGKQAQFASYSLESFWLNSQGMWESGSQRLEKYVVLLFFLSIFIPEIAIRNSKEIQ